MAKSKRVKSDKPAIIPINDWGHADNIVRKTGDLQQKINQAEHQAKDDINKIKAALAIAVKPFQEELKLLICSLEAFANSRREDFKKARSRKLNFGVLGWRKSSSVSIKKNTLERIKKVLSKAKARACIRTKESVDKDALAKFTDGQLASVGARREEKDVFFVEPDLPEAVDYCE